MNTIFKAGLSLAVAVGSAIAATYYLKNGGIAEAKDLLANKNCNDSECEHDDHMGNVAIDLDETIDARVVCDGEPTV